MKRSFRLLKLIAKFSLIEQTSFAPSFWFAVIGKTLRIILLLIFYQGLFQTVPVFAGWTKDEAYLLVGFFALVETSLSVTFHRNFAYHLAEEVHDGTFDHTLTKPIPTLLAVGLKRIDIMDLASLVPILFVIGTGLRLNALTPSGPHLIYGLSFALLGFLFLFSLYLAIGALTFRTIIGGGPGRLAEAVVRMGQIPTDIYTGASRLIFVYILPISLVATAPVQAFLGKTSLAQLAISALIVLVLFLASYRFWQSGLASYSSANG